MWQQKLQPRVQSTLTAWPRTLASTISSTRLWKVTTACRSRRGSRTSRKSVPASRSQAAGSVMATIEPSASRLLGRHHVRDRALGDLGAEEHGFGKRGVCVDGEADVLGIRAHFEREHRLRDELAGIDADDPRTQEALRALLEEKLRDAFLAPHAQRPPARRPREDGLLVLDA